VSEETSRLIDSEVRAIVTAGYDRAKQLLTEHIDQLHAIAGALLEYETLTGDEIRKVMDGGTIDRSTTTTPVSRPSSSASAIPKAGRRGAGPSVGEAPAGA
jgi:cell division protease FtsH